MFNRDQYARTGRDQTGVIEEDIHGAIKDTIAKYTRQMEDIMSGLSDKQLRAMSNIMRGQYRNKQTGAIQIPSSLGISVDKARKMRRLMNAVYSELEQAYTSAVEQHHQKS